MDPKDQRGSLSSDEAPKKSQKIPVVHPALKDVGLPFPDDPDESKEAFEAALRVV